MTRGLHSSLASSLTANEVNLMLLLEVATGTTPATLYFTTDESDFYYTPTASTYEARPLDIGDIRMEGGETPAVRIVLADVDSYMDTWLLSTDFRHQKVIRRIIVRDHVSSIVSSTTDSLRITNHEREGYNFVFTAEPLLGILGRINLPARVMIREDFPGMPREGVVR